MDKITAAITGIEAYRPDYILRNQELEKIISNPSISSKICSCNTLDFIFINPASTNFIPNLFTFKIAYPQLIVPGSIPKILYSCKLILIFKSYSRFHIFHITFIHIK